MHTYCFDVVGRATADAVTTLGTGVDGAVRRLETAYDTADRANLFTSYNAASAGSIVNLVQQEYNGLGQLTKEWQAQAGAVNTSTSPKVQYAYSEMSGGANHSRPTSMTYPNGRVLNFTYSTGLDSTISRLSSIDDSGVTLEAFSYLGQGSLIKRAHPQPGVDLTYIKQGADSNGDAGDQYTGLDRFGRVVDQRWLKTSDGIHTDRFKYGHDRNSSRLYRDNLLNDSFDELYHANGASAGYDQLNQLTDFRRGALSHTNSDNIPDTVTSPSRQQGWDFDALGNFDAQTTDGTPQTRTHNKQNQSTVVGGNNLTFDSNGNTTKDETGKTYTFDAVNHLVLAKDSGGSTIASYSFDPLGRRIIETVSGTTRDIFFSPGWQVIEEHISGTAKTQYVWSPVYIDALIARDRDADRNGSLEERLYAQQDATFNVAAVITSSGSVVERYVYDPYGMPTFLNASWTSIGSSAYAWLVLHQGGRFETATQLYLSRYRDYSPGLGRWWKHDPLSLTPVDTHLYRYLGNAPPMWTAPSGLIRLNLVRITVAAFINGRRLGQWLPEPMPFSDWHFETNHRDCGGPLADSKVVRYATLDLTTLGKVRHIRPHGHYGGWSTRRRLVRGGIWPFWQEEWFDVHTRMPNVSGYEVYLNWLWSATYIELKASAGYPFAWYSPNIDYLLEIRFDTTGSAGFPVRLFLIHNLFPDYEIRIADKVIYCYRSSYSGPGILTLNRRTRLDYEGTLDDSPAVAE